jgi:ATP-binding cassette subfamily B protein
MINDNRSILQNVPILSFLPAETRNLIVDSFVPETFAFGNPIVREGEEARAFYVVASGRVRVVKQADRGDEISLNTLKTGDTFGEMGLLDQEVSKATVRASGEVTVYKLDKSVFQALLRSKPEIRKYLELQKKHRSLHNFFRLYSPFTTLSSQHLAGLLSELESIQVEPQTVVIRQDDPPGPMFLIEDGRLRVFHQPNGHRQYLAYLRKGDFFGEMSVFKGANRAASVEAVTPCRLLQLNEMTMQKLLKDCPEFRAKLEERIAQYEYKEAARVPLDFTEELLPAETEVHEKVSSDQVDLDEEEEDPEESRIAPFASEEGYFVKRGKKIRRFRHLFQIDEMDCGPACLGMICGYYGRKVSLTRIRQMTYCDTEGTSLSALSNAAAELGLASQSVKSSRRHLGQMPLPAIVHWEGNHWVVLYDVQKDFVRFSDPAIGNRKFSRQEFEKKWTGYAVLFDYTKDFEKVRPAVSGFGWFAKFFAPFHGILIKAILLAAVVSALQMVLPVFTQIIVDRVLVEQDLGLLHTMIFSLAAVLIFMTLAVIVQRYLLSFAAVRIDASSLDFLTRKLLALPLSYFQTRRTGDIQRRLQGLRLVREFLVENGVSALTAIAQLCTVLLLMFVYSPLLAFVFISVAPLYGFLMYFSRRWLRPLFDDVEEAFGKYSSHQIDAIKGIETIKALGAENRFREIMLSQFYGVARHLFKSDFTTLCYDGVVQITTFTSMALFLWVGTHQVLNGNLTIGGLVAFNALVALANAPITTFLQLWDRLQFADILVNRLNDVVQQEPEQGADRSRLLPVKSLEGRIRLQNVSYRYGSSETPKILDGIDLEVSAGKTIAIVGRSGSGKTTLVKLLAGLMEPVEGSIHYDGFDLKTLNYRDLRKRIGFVLQENYLFNDTIARNVAFGETEPDMDRVIWAARTANAHEFIERLPLSYDTRIGESGIMLSGGQRQRIAIARALYFQPSVLIFDEATSALDTESEKAIQQNMEQVLNDRTCFVIAHRLSTVRDADLIVVLERGKIVETGNHDQLMERRGLYFYLCSQQLGV